MNAKVQIGAELLCKGGKVDTGRDSTACYPRGIEAARLARSANPTRYKVKGGAGSGMLEGERTRRSRAPTRYKEGNRGAGSWRGGAVSVIRNLYSVISRLSASPHSHWHLTDLW